MAYIGMEQAQPIGQMANPVSQPVVGETLKTEKQGAAQPVAQLGQSEQSTFILPAPMTTLGESTFGQKMETIPLVASGPSTSSPGSGSDIKWWLKKIYEEQKKLKKQMQSLIDQASKNENSENSDNNSSGGGKTRRKYKKKRATRRR